MIRLWIEVSQSLIKCDASSTDDFHLSNARYVFYNKGGSYRKWYGNIDYVLKYDIASYNILLNQGNHLPSRDRYFQECITWTDLSTKGVAFRLEPKGTVFDGSAATAFGDHEILLYSLGLLNSKYTDVLARLLNPSLHFKLGDYNRIPYIFDERKKETVTALVRDCIETSKKDWDSFETSYDFSVHPLVRWSKGLWDATAIGATMHFFYGGHPEVSCPLELCYMLWQGECNVRFKQLKSNEEELNRIFIDIYGLQDELTPEVEDKDVTVRRADLGRDIRSLVSYAVGCMFGRYSLDVEGLAFAGGDWDASKYTSFQPDEDNVIPITDEAYLEDDIVTRFVEFIRTVYGSDSLEDNLDFIAKALGNKGSTSREVIRNYFLNDFFNDHCQTYSVTGSGKRPIYWLFDSGKQNGFKALIYLHRYTPDTVGTVRVDYLHRLQRVYESEIDRMQDMIDNSSNSREIAAATKRKEKLIKQLKECRDYDEKLAHLALARIALDLDDGVKVNYRKLQTAPDGKFYEVLAQSKNIMAKEK